MDIDWEEKAKKAWVKLIELAKSRKDCSYKELGDIIGIHHRSVRFALDSIQEYCLSNNLPPITILVVNGSGKPGKGFKGASENNFDKRRNDVFSYNWNKIIDSFDFSTEGYTQVAVINNIIEKKEIPKKVLRFVLDRGWLQIIFKKALMEVYSGKCCICGLSIKELLQAAHIRPYRECTDEEKISVNNGLLLCANHHRLFDSESKKLKISKEYKIIIKIKENDEKNESNRKFISSYNGRMINLPKKSDHYPNILD